MFIPSITAFFFYAVSSCYTLKSCFLKVNGGAVDLGSRGGSMCVCVVFWGVVEVEGRETLVRMNLMRE